MQLSIFNYKLDTFGSGPRNCSGKIFALYEMKMIIYQLLKNFEVKSEILPGACINQGIHNAKMLLSPKEK